MAKHDRQPGERLYWALFSRPDRYDAIAALRDSDVDTWLVNRGDVRAGDQAIIWQGRDRSGRRGILAFVDILSDPTDLGPDTEHWVGPPVPGPRVRIRCRSAPGLPLLFASAHLPPELAALSISRAQGNTVFRVTPEQWNAVVALAGGSDDDETTETAQVEHDVRLLGSAQGFRIDSEARRAIDKYAMARSRELLEQEGWNVEDVSATRSYDFHCRRNAEELRVEVKGTQSSGCSVVVTPNEVRLSRE